MCHPEMTTAMGPNEEPSFNETQPAPDPAAPEPTHSASDDSDLSPFESPKPKVSIKPAPRPNLVARTRATFDELRSNLLTNLKTLKVQIAQKVADLKATLPSRSTPAMAEFPSAAPMDPVFEEDEQPVVTSAADAPVAASPAISPSVEIKSSVTPAPATPVPTRLVATKPASSKVPSRLTRARARLNAFGDKLSAQIQAYFKAQKKAPQPAKLSAMSAGSTITATSNASSKSGPGTFQRARAGLNAFGDTVAAGAAGLFSASLFAASTSKKAALPAEPRTSEPPFDADPSLDAKPSRFTLARARLNAFGDSVADRFQYYFQLRPSARKSPVLAAKAKVVEPVIAPPTQPAPDAGPVGGDIAATAVAGAAMVVAGETVADAKSKADPKAPAKPDDSLPSAAFRKPPRRRTDNSRWPTNAAELFTPEKAAKRVLVFSRVFLILLGIALVGLIFRVVQLQTRPNPKILAMVDSQISSQRIHGRPGNIETRGGQLLATSRIATSTFVDPHIVPDADRNSFSEHVCLPLDYDPAMIEQKMTAHPNSKFIRLDRRVDEDRLEKLKDFKLRGFGTETRLVRDYPQGTLAGQLLGFASLDSKHYDLIQGMDGIEKAFAGKIAGSSGKISYARDARHRPLWVQNGSYQAPTDGDSIRLTLDLTIQSIAETELSAACQNFDAKSGELLVMDPNNGEILALANYPSVDPNKFGTAPPDARRDRVVTDTYEPGSTFKPFIWSTAIEKGFARPNEMIDCGPGSWTSSTGRHLHDAHGVGRVTCDEVLVKSSNIGMAIIGERMGAQRLYEAVRNFGFGSSTGSGIPGEVNGRIAPLPKWTTFSITSVPMGQEVAVTPIQMARAFCALANGGTLYTPNLLFYDPKNPDPFQPEGRLVITPAITAHAREVLRRVVTEGTGKKAISPLYSIFGKTGTAQMAGPGKGGYIPDAYVGSFICAAPLDHPRIVVLCVIHRPDKSKGHFGGIVAAPAAKNVVEQTLTYLGIAPDIQADDTSNSALPQVRPAGPGDLHFASE